MADTDDGHEDCGLAVEAEDYSVITNPKPMEW